MIWFMFAIVVLCLAGINKADNNNFGPYELIWTKFTSCKGPKQGECGKFEIHNTKNMSDVIFTLDFQKDCPVNKARVIAGSVQNSNYTKKLWNYALDKPCQHFVLGPIMMESFNLTNSCKVKKGQYTIHLNMNNKATMFLGSNFFYGTYVFKIIAFNNVNNFFCVSTKLDARKP